MKIRNWIFLPVVAIGMGLHGGACTEKIDTSLTLPDITHPQDNKTIDWNDRTSGEVYTESAAAEDFGGIDGWASNRVHIIDGTCRVTLLKDALSGDGGLISRTTVPSGTEYELSFDIKFDAEFDWSRGGKAGLGFRIGSAFTGCNPAWSGTGGTMRLMWYQNDAGRVYFIPYLYYKDMPGSCGFNFNKFFPHDASLERDKWYTVYMYIKSNTGENEDGRAVIEIDGQTLLDESIRWTTNDAFRKVNGISFATFRGGSENHWKSDQNAYIYFDNFSWKKLSAD